MYRIIKRFLDIVLSVIGIIVTSPIWIIAIIGILVNDFGPIFYKARRIGKDDKEFTMLKFRSMRVLKEPKEGSEASLRPEHDRIFAWGRIMRKLKIDELPQLINIVNGTMSIVGPRPVAKDQFQIFRTGKYDIAKAVCPGLTGAAALFDYIYGDQFEDSDIDTYVKKVLPTRKELEVAYIRKIGFGFDFKMIIWTVWSICCSIIGKIPQRILDELIDLAEENKVQENDKWISKV